MSSDLFVLDETYCYHNFLSDPFSVSDSSIDSLLQGISDEQITTQNCTFSVDGSQNLDQISQTQLSNSPPSHQMETLSLVGQTQMSNLSNGLSDYPVCDIKSEDFEMGSGIYSSSYNSYLGNYDFGGENLGKFMQMGCYSNSNSLVQPGGFDCQNLQSLSCCDEISYSAGNMRRVFSTGDLPEAKMNQNGVIQEANFKVGKYSAEERKERIDKYRAKRNLRNFNKTVKYACRKTLADNRPRIRGRFARNEDTGEIPKPTSSFPSFFDDDDLWGESNVQEEDEEGRRRRGTEYQQYYYCSGY